MKAGPGSVRGIGCTFYYAKKECFVNYDGSKSVCTFCYETTRSKHLKNYGYIKMNRDLFEFANFLMYDTMRINPEVSFCNFNCEKVNNLMIICYLVYNNEIKTHV